MLENNEPIQGLDQARVFSVMVEQIPWPNLRAYVQANAQVMKLCSVGGYRLEPKTRDRIHRVLLREAQKAEFSQAFCNGLFVPWYPSHTELHKTIEDYFHSEEYKKHRETNNLGEDVYVLPDDVFERFFKVNDLEKWHVLLCFSPLQFTKSQAQKLVSETGGNAELISRLRDMEARMQDLDKEHNRLLSEHQTIKSQYEQASAATQESRKVERTLRTDYAGLEKKLEVSQAENRRLRERIQDLEKTQAQAATLLAEQMAQTTTRLERDTQRVTAERDAWQIKYEQLRGENRELERKLHEAKQQIHAAEHQLQQLRAEMEHLSSFPALLFNKFDWPKVGAQLKLTPALSRQFNSLIRKLSYEQDRSLTIEGTLPQFWERLMTTERDLIDNIAKSNSREVMKGNAEKYWMDLTDSFEDVRIGLEARTILLKMLHEIFYQILELDDLEAPIVPLGKTKDTGI
ncbi:MAG: hypothetical protein A3K19_04170 [Lentisphaerae bacterium RIFOXYB12_FULL_65_16]|nr:MAG: hypothetical protein A3K18_09530 [Lentisphaerae bacterium RIFOXYA12_64_32]OGV84281.1 MAG: hypothetical protein A3K19_04170 [Lentisphaerae bacterium RIFOXYB12_FULL_65_16]